VLLVTKRHLNLPDCLLLTQQILHLPLGCLYLLLLLLLLLLLYWRHALLLLPWHLLLLWRLLLDHCLLMPVVSWLRSVESQVEPVFCSGGRGSSCRHQHTQHIEGHYGDSTDTDCIVTKWTQFQWTQMSNS
jgi:hypothetical protein